MTIRNGRRTPTKHDLSDCNPAGGSRFGCRLFRRRRGNCHRGRPPPQPRAIPPSPAHHPNLGTGRRTLAWRTARMMKLLAIAECVCMVAMFLLLLRETSRLRRYRLKIEKSIREAVANERKDAPPGAPPDDRHLICFHRQLVQEFLLPSKTRRRRTGKREGPRMKTRSKLVWRASFVQPISTALNPMALRMKSPITVEIRRSKGMYRAYAPNSDNEFPITAQPQAATMMSQTDMCFECRAAPWQALEIDPDPETRERALSPQDWYTDQEGHSHIRRRPAAPPAQP